MKDIDRRAWTIETKNVITGLLKQFRDIHETTRGDAQPGEDQLTATRDLAQSVSALVREKTDEFRAQRYTELQHRYLFGERDNLRRRLSAWEGHCKQLVSDIRHTARALGIENPEISSEALLKRFQEIKTCDSGAQLAVPRISDDRCEKIASAIGRLSDTSERAKVVASNGKRALLHYLEKEAEVSRLEVKILEYKARGSHVVERKQTALDKTRAWLSQNPKALIYDNLREQAREILVDARATLGDLQELVAGLGKESETQDSPVSAVDADSNNEISREVRRFELETRLDLTCLFIRDALQAASSGTAWGVDLNRPDEFPLIYARAHRGDPAAKDFLQGYLESVVSTVVLASKVTESPEISTHQFVQLLGKVYHRTVTSNELRFTVQLVKEACRLLSDRLERHSRVREPLILREFPGRST